MKTRTRKYSGNILSKKELLNNIVYEEAKEITDPMIRFFPAFVSFFLLFMFLLVTHLAYRGEMIYITIIFFTLSLLAWIYTIRKIIVIKSPYTFYWNPKEYDTINIKNSYNYSISPNLTKITKSKFWKFIYFSEYYYKIIFSILWLPLIGIFIMAFTLKSTWALPSTSFILTLIFWPSIFACTKLILSMIKMRSQIYSNINNFYYISRKSKSLGFSMKNNQQWWVDYYFQK